MLNQRQLYFKKIVNMPENWWNPQIILDFDAVFSLENAGYML